MQWSRPLSALRRGIRLVTGLVKAKLGLGAAPPAPSPPPPPEISQLLTIADFGDNPGRLGMQAYVPPSVGGRPLVVLLHGCGQDAVRFAEDSGWIDLADHVRFTLLLPEQTAANNQGRCFQWFQPRHNGHIDTVIVTFFNVVKVMVVVEEHLCGNVIATEVYFPL